jgi:hypothetical protein
MWLSTMMSVGRRGSALNVSNARASMVRSLASPTRVTFQPCPMNRVATSSVKASAVSPSMLMWLLS